MASASTMQFSDVRSILRWLAVQFPDYKLQCVLLLLRAHGEILKMAEFSQEMIELSQKMIELFQEMIELSQVMIELYLLASIGCKSIGMLDNGDHSLPVSDPIGQAVALWVVRIVGTMYRETQQCDKAISLLETVIHLFGRDLHLENAETWYFYNRLLIELAHCCAEDGHHDEARDLLDNKIKFPSNLRCSRRFKEVGVGLFRCTLQQHRQDALQVVEELENVRGGTRSSQKHHARLQEGSSQPEVSAWDPFLTDCIEWDKI